MNKITKAERDALIDAARRAIVLDSNGNIIGGFEPAWQAFQAEHDISDYRARAYVSHAARLLRGERARPGPGRPPRMEPGERVTVWLTPDHIKVATRLGDGNISAGVRLALERTDRSTI